MSAHTATGSIRVVAIEQLRISYAPLRPGCPRHARTREPAALPIRVVPIADGCFDVLDGFKRLRAYQEQGGPLEWPTAANRRGSHESRPTVARAAKRAEKAAAISDDHATLRLGDYEFHHISAIEPERQADGSLRDFMPQARYDNEAGLSLNRYGNGPFHKFKIPRNQDIPGVYALVVNGEVRYIGECAKLSSRFNMGYGNISPRNCFLRGQQTNCRINNRVLREAKAGSDISLWFLATDEHKAVEKELRDSLSLSWNRV